MSARSYLFVPGDRPEMLAKVATRGADAVIADLEDAVAPQGKAAARAIVADWLGALVRQPFEAWVRVNPEGHFLAADIAAIVGPQLAGVMLPKVDSPADVGIAGNLISDREASCGLSAGAIKLLPIIETARGVLAVNEIAAMPRVHQLMIGELDLAADLGVDPNDEIAFVPLRMQVVIASAAAGIAAPLGPVSPDYRDLGSLRLETDRLRRLGFGSRPAIHPAQVAVYNDALTPTSAEVERAARLVAIYEEALAAGRGAVSDDDGRMVDEAVIKVARRLLARARPGWESQP